MIEPNKIYQGDTLEVLKSWPDDFVDTIVTSPPYWGLRDYGVEGQIGLEPTLDEYLDKLLVVTGELQRVLKPTGVMFWNHGDCYGGSGCGKGDYRENYSLSKPERYKDKPNPQLKLRPKCLAGQNYRLILRMVDEQNWILRNSICWWKPNAMPSSVKDRFSNSYEPVFMLVKNKKYDFDLDAVRVPHRTNEGRPPGVVRKRIFNYRVRDAEKKAKMCPQFKASKEEIERYKFLGHQNPNRVGRDYKDPEKAIEAKMNWYKHPRQKTQKEDYKVGGMKNAPEPGEPNAFHSVGKNPGDVWKIPTHPFPEAHFATFPPKLIEPMIKASCPQWVCPKCGKVRVRITEKEYVPHRKAKNLTSPRENSSYIASQGKVCNAEYQTIGWTDCGCNAGWEAGICLDPFMGSGTTALVARKLARNYLGIELSEDYIKIAEERLKQEHLGI